MIGNRSDLDGRLNSTLVSPASVRCDRLSVGRMVQQASSSSSSSSSSYPASFTRALWAYPSLLLALSVALGSRRPSGSQHAAVRDRQHWGDATQKALKLVSSIHALLTSYLAARDVFDRKWTSLNLITTRSPDANAVVAVEAGYLIQDTVVSALLDSCWSPVNLFVSGSSLHRVRFDGLLLAHHVSLGGLLTLFLEFARRGKERGVFFVEMFLLMNASTPLLNLRWYLSKRARQTSPHQQSSLSVSRMRKMSAANDIALAATFFVCRIGLIFYMLRIYGLRTRRSILQSYLSIPIQCKTGTAALLILNSLWWLGLLRKTLSRVKQKKI